MDKRYSEIKGKIKDSASARAFWSLHDRRQRQIVSKYTPKIFNAIRGQINAFLKSVKEDGYQYAKLNIYNIVRFDGIAKVVKDLYLKSAYIESNYVINYLDKKQNKSIEVKRVKPRSASFGLTFDDLGPVINSYFQIRLLNESALPITETTRKFIIRHLINEVDSGKDFDQAVKDFKTLALTGDKPKALIRARRIALTETTKAMSFGGVIGAYMTGIDVEKVWVTSDDERVRVVPFSHVRLDLNSQVLLGEFWNGERIKFPGDPDASIENTAGCRCAMYFREKPKPKKRVVRDILNFLNDFLAGALLGISFQVGQELAE